MRLPSVRNPIGRCRPTRCDEGSPAMMIKDVIPGFELYRPTTVADAVALLDQHKKDAWKIAGGNDSLSWFKDRIKRPKAVIDLTGIAEMRGVKETADGIEI